MVNVGIYIYIPFVPWILWVSILPMTCIGHIPTARCEIAEVLSFDPLGAYRQGLSYPYHEGFTTHGQRRGGGPG